MCGSDNINYMSPCHAGCQLQENAVCTSLLVLSCWLGRSSNEVLFTYGLKGEVLSVFLTLVNKPVHLN